MAGRYGNVPPAPKKKAPASGVKAFDPEAFAKMRGGLAQDKAYQQGADQRAAAKDAATAAVVVAKPVPKKTLLDNITGLKSRKKQAGA